MGRQPASSYYDVLARTYDEQWQHYMDSTLSVLLAHLDLHPDLHLLDIGCGTGELLVRLAALAPTAQLVGIDASRGILRVARRKLKGVAQVSLVYGTAEVLPVGDQTQDVITAASVLHYLNRPSLVCAAAHRALKPGGTLVVVDYVPRLAHGSVVDGLIRRYDPGHTRCRTRSELAAMFAWAGFTAIEVEYFPIDAVFRGVLGTAQRA